jgi:UDP-N-acetylglucosamine--N-acetylmuramyl-(pentapeptide) pyrophosphoryl-undecaprenol N-acetylglucosamine transferase
MKNIERVIISGGGTGGHIFPAIAIANEIKSQYPSAIITFVGAEGKMEMEKVPAAGYQIIGLPIVGFQRKLSLSNFFLPFKLIKSLWKARAILKTHQPQVVIGVGGYASGPTLKMAQQLNIPTVIQEQNSFPGKTNRLLAKKVARVCTAYNGLDTVFPVDKIRLTGNPVRSELATITLDRTTAFSFFDGLDPTKKTILVIGGSLGARTLNEAVQFSLQEITDAGYQIIWQCGKFYHAQMREFLNEKPCKGVYLCDFIARMDAAYTAADCIVSRAGALSISELCLIGKPTFLVPSPNVSEDHQTKNALALVANDAALLVKDDVAKTTLFQEVLMLLTNNERSEQLAANIKKMGLPNATKDIVSIITEIVNK